MRLFFRLLYIGVPVSIFLSVVGQMIVANQMIVLGNKLAVMNRRIDELHGQNDYLKKRISQTTSIQRVAMQAKQMGFIDANSYIAFDSESFPIAIKR